MEIKTTSQKCKNGFPTKYLSHDTDQYSVNNGDQYFQMYSSAMGDCYLIVCDYDVWSKETTVIMVRECSLLLMSVQLNIER